MAVFTFNLGGYYIAFKVLQVSAHRDLIQKLESEQYNESETIHLKIPITIPYATNSSNGFKRVDGRFEYKGDIYKLVKQKYQNDTLYIVCLKDFKEKQLINKFQEYAKTTHDTPGTSSKKDSSRTIKQINKDYFGDSGQMLPDLNGTIVIAEFSIYQFSQLSIEEDIPTPPPRA